MLTRTNILHEVIPEVVRGDHQTPEVDKGGCRHHRERDPGDVDDLETPQGEEADLTNLVKNVFAWNKIYLRMLMLIRHNDDHTIMSVQLEVHQFKSLESGQVIEQILHVLKNHAPSTKYLHLVVFLCKVTGKHVGEAFYIGQLLMVNHAPP